MFPRSKLLAGVVGATLLVGCASAPPATYSVANSRYYPSNKDAVFQRLLEVSTRSDMYVTAKDKKLGVITVERSVVTPTRSGAIYDWADCGLVSLAERPISQLAELNMVVEPEGGGARVTINTRFSELRQNFRRETHRLTCTSTGALERQMLELMAR